MMKFLQKAVMASDVDNSAELNNNRKEHRQFDNRTDTGDILSPTSSSLSPSPPDGNSYNSTSSPTQALIKKPPHFHHPEYVSDTSIVVSSRRVPVNIHPDSGVDHSSIMDQDNSHWRTTSNNRSSNRRSWYSAYDEQEEEQFERIDLMREEKRRRNVEEIKKLPCGLGKMVLVEHEKQEADMVKQGLDPIWASRSPNASNLVMSKPRYKSPVNASPSRTLREARDQTKSVQCLLSQPDDNAEFRDEDRNELKEVSLDNGTFIVVNDERALPKGTSMPEIAGNFKLFPYHILTTQNARLPKGVDRTRLEQHLTYKEFQEIFGMNRDDFKRLPKWKRMDMKKRVHLF